MASIDIRKQIVDDGPGGWYLCGMANRRTDRTALLLYAALCVFTVTLLWALAPGELRVTPDTTRDFVQSRMFLRAHPPRLAGPMTSLLGFFQGSLWYLYLGALEALGLGITGMRAVASLLTVVAVIVTAVLARRSYGPAAGLFAGLLLLAVLVSHPLRYLHTLWNPVLIPLPAALFCGALLRAARRPSIGRCAGAAVLLSLIVQLHIVGAVMALPAALALLWLPSGTRLKCAVWSVVAFLVCGLVLSPHAAMDNLQAIGNLSHGAFGQGGGPRTVPAAVWLHLAAFLVASAVLAAPGPERRSWTRGTRALVLVMGGGLGLLLLLVWMLAHHFEDYYLMPIQPGISILAAGALGRVLSLGMSRLPVDPHGRMRRITPVALLLLAFLASIAIALPKLASSHSESTRTEVALRLTYRDVAAVAAVLPGLGVDTLIQAAATLRSPEWSLLVGALDMHLPRSLDGETPLPPQTYLVVRLPDRVLEELEELEEPGVVVARQDRGSAVVLLPMPRVLRWEQGELTIRVGEGTDDDRLRGGLTYDVDSIPGYPALVGLPTSARSFTGWRLRIPVSGAEQDLSIVPMCPNRFGDCVATVSARSDASTGWVRVRPGQDVELQLTWDFEPQPGFYRSSVPPIIVYPKSDPGWQVVVGSLQSP